MSISLSGQFKLANGGMVVIVGQLDTSTILSITNSGLSVISVDGVTDKLEPGCTLVAQVTPKRQVAVRGVGAVEGSYTLAIL
jgi:hypothetical protein